MHELFDQACFNPNPELPSSDPNNFAVMLPPVGMKDKNGRSIPLPVFTYVDGKIVAIDGNHIAVT